MPPLEVIEKYLPYHGAWTLAIMVMLDFVLGMTLAVSTATFSLKRFRDGVWKIGLWAVLLLVASLLHEPSGMWSDLPAAFLGDYLIFYICTVELLSVLRNILALAVLHNASLPGLPAFIDLVEQWGDEGLNRLRGRLAVSPANQTTTPTGTTPADAPTNTGKA